MKTKKFKLLILAIFFSSLSFAQLTGKELRQKNKDLKIQEIQQLIESNKFVFKASSLTTSTGYHKTLNSEYDFTVKNDSAFSYLPFWGILYMPGNMDEDGVKFESKIEEYKKKNKGKKGYEISFSVNGKDDSYQISCDISLEGYTDLTVISNRRSYISYYGRIEAIAP